jgi:hypothetical protein
MHQKTAAPNPVDFENKVVNLLKNRIKGFTSAGKSTGGTAGALGGALLGAGTQAVGQMGGDMDDLSGRQKMNRYLGAMATGGMAGAGLGGVIGRRVGLKNKLEAVKSQRNLLENTISKDLAAGLSHGDVVKKLEKTVPHMHAADIHATSGESGLLGDFHADMLAKQKKINSPKMENLNLSQQKEIDKMLKAYEESIKPRVDTVREGIEGKTMKERSGNVPEAGSFTGVDLGKSKNKHKGGMLDMVKAMLGLKTPAKKAPAMPSNSAKGTKMGPLRGKDTQVDVTPEGFAPMDANVDVPSFTKRQKMQGPDAPPAPAPASPAPTILKDLMSRKEIALREMQEARAKFQMDPSDALNIQNYKELQEKYSLLNNLDNLHKKMISTEGTSEGIAHARQFYSVLKSLGFNI